MTAEQNKPGPQSVWERAPAPRRAAPSPLSREGIVQCAIGIADREGLAALSLRKVAGALDAGAMRLYTHMASKEELLELMVDAVYGEMLAMPVADGDWRAALRSIARRTRRAALAHPWFVELLGGRPHFGPNALAYLEASFGALDRAQGFAHVDLAMRALKTVNAYVIGAIRAEAGELLAEAESGMNKGEWQTATGDYLRRVLASGRYPSLTAVYHEAIHHPPETVFEQGLDSVLDGIAALLVRPAQAY